jgi:nucleoside-diphosphate-sugar epimerase
MTNKKILVTGGSGFIGSHMIDKLITLGYEVTNLDLRPPKEPNKAKLILGNICDDAILESVRRIGPQIIIHLAAKSRFKFGFDDPLSTYQTNVIGTLKMMETASKVEKFEKFIYVSSEQAYGIAESIPISEQHPLRPYNIYGASKAAADMLAQVYAGKLPMLILRTGMGYGPRSPPDQVITKFFLNGMASKPILFDPIIERNQSLSPTRDCNYVTNIIDGFALAMRAEMKTGSIINIGSGSEVSILELGKMIAAKTNGKVIFSETYKERPGELGRRFLLDISKARKTLGYRPKILLQEGLELTYQWLKNNPKYFTEVSE